LQENVLRKSRIKTGITLLARLPNRSIYISISAARTTETDLPCMLVSTITELIYHAPLSALGRERIASHRPWPLSHSPQVNFVTKVLYIKPLFA
jgi:hypothetical protein